MDHERLVAWGTNAVVEYPGRIVLAFLLVTAGFGAGLGSVSTSAGTQQFAQEVPAERAFQNIQEDFGPRFAPAQGSTQLIQHAPNVLSKPAMLRMLRAERALRQREELRIATTSSAAGIVATTLDPTATTPAARIDAVERATPGEIDAAVRTAAARNPRFTGLLSTDFSRSGASASATIGVVSHELPAGLGAGSGQGGSSPLTTIQLEVRHVVHATGATDVRVFGSGVISAEFSRVIVDSLILVVPAAVLFILLFLALAYRDAADLLLGLVALGMALVWTFGFMGLAGIPFSQVLITVPPLLLAVGIDFGIHTVNRYREELADGYEREPAMERAADQLLVAFFIVTGTTVIGFSANFASQLVPIRQFGLVAAVGIVFTFLVFGVFMPAAKVLLDDARSRYPIPTMSTRPLGSEGSPLARVLTGGVAIARRAPVVFLVVSLLVAGGAGAYATDIDTSFETEDFLPPADTPDYLEALPEPFAPSDYSVTADLAFLERKFETTRGDSVTVYVQGPLERDDALEAIHRAGRDPPDSFVASDRQASATSIVTVVRDRARRDPEFAALVARNDADGNGIPDDDIGAVYDYLLQSSSRERALNYMTADRRSARVVYTVEADASQAAIADDARTVADRTRYSATATGSTVVFQAISDLIFESAVVSLSIALGVTIVFLIVVYRVLEGRASLGVVNTIPIVVAVALVAGTMRLFAIPFNAITATVLAITIGLGIDYSVHVTHRFADEYEAGGDGDPVFRALDRTVRGTGGALAGTMLTTVFGIGVLVLAVFPVIGQFGILTGLSVIYSFLASLVVLPSALVVWARTVG